MGFGAGGLRIPIPIRVHAELLWLLPAFFLFLSHPFLYATFANLPVFLLFLFFFSPSLPTPPSLSLPFPRFFRLVPALCLCWRGQRSNYLIFGEREPQPIRSPSAFRSSDF